MPDPEDSKQEQSGPKPKLQAMTAKVGGGTSKMKQAVEFFGEHPFVTGLLALLGVFGMVLSIIAYQIDREDSKQTGEQLSQVEVALASVTSELQNQRDYIRGAAGAYLELKSQYEALKASDEELWQRALDKVAAAEGVPIVQVEGAIALFVASVGQNENASQMDKALAKFAAGEFASAGDLALLAAEEAARKRIAAEELLEKMEASRKTAANEELAAFTLAGQARFAQGLYPEAIDAFEKALATNPTLRTDDPGKWGFLHLNLSDAAALYANVLEGIAVQQWQQRATDGYHKCMEVFTKEASSAAWASAQHGLALNLWGQSKSAVGAAQNRLLEESLDAYNQVLELWKSEGAQVSWALALTNRSAVLTDLAAHADGVARADLLRRAVAANRQALEASSREQNPARWADCLNNLASSLQVQSTTVPIEEGNALLQEAVSCFRLTLEVRTRDALPVDWARTQLNLAIVLQEQGYAAEKEQARLELWEASMVANHAALEVFTRESFPQEWADAQRVLATSLSNLAYRSPAEDQARLFGEAVQAYRNALEVQTREIRPLDWASSQNNIGSSLTIQAEQAVGAEKLRLLEESIAAYRLSLEVYTLEDQPQKWRRGLNNLAFPVKAQAKEADGIERTRLYGEAVKIYRQSLAETSQEVIPEEWANTQGLLAGALFDQSLSAKGEESLRLLEEAVVAIRAALPIWAETKSAEDCAAYQAWVGEMEVEIAALGEGD